MLSFEPEEGDALTFGFVYEPQFAKGLSLSIDYWDYSIDNVITQVDVNTAAQVCVATGSPQFCGYTNRFPDGTIQQILEPTINLGSLDTSGVDFSVAYALADYRLRGFPFRRGRYLHGQVRQHRCRHSGHWRLPATTTASTATSRNGGRALNVGWEYQRLHCPGDPAANRLRSA